jgi:4-hydroxythreonine-4-phosphate dehydrogenase
MSAKTVSPSGRPDQEGRTKAPSWLILADDLTGAADCAIAFAKQGMASVVAWGAGPESGEASVVSVDVDSRRFPAVAAVSRQLAAQAAHWRPGVRLYKKIDSTLRGQPAAELAAQLAALAAAGGSAPLAVVAPAFPATGRVTLGGRVVVNGMALEDTPLWARDHTYASAALPEVLGSAGIRSQVIPLEVVHAGVEAVLARMKAAGRQGMAAVVCDCATEADLATVAAASLGLGQAVWVGSAGLAAAFAVLEGPVNPPRPALSRRPGPVLTVVGSLAEISRTQARALADGGLVRHLSIPPATLFAGPEAPDWRVAAAALAEALASGGDVLLELALAPDPDLEQGPFLAERLAELVKTVVPRIGALVATGGDTACALLWNLGVRGIRLVDEIEPGVPLGVTLGPWSIPVVTKAGAFGDAGTLRRCLERLKT